MDTLEIESVLASDQFTAPSFNGVFACDRLPQKIRFPCSLVANTDPHGRPGRHWIAIHYEKNGNAECFDSYGLPPMGRIKEFFESHGRNHKYNQVTLQGPRSKVCGHYCIAYLTRRCQGESFKDIVDSYTGKRPGDYDCSVRNFVARNYRNVLLLKSRCRRQTCQARRQ